MISFKKLLCGLAAAAVLTASFSPAIFAAKNIGHVEVTNNLKTGDIRISIKELEGDRKTPYDMVNPKTVLPGQPVDKVVQVHNEAEEAWIRVTAEWDSQGNGVAMDTSMLVLSDPEKWKRVGDYWYYLEPVPNGKYAEFIEGFRVPNFGNEVSELGFDLYITAEAVQSKNFTPNFDDDVDPWNGTLIEYCEHHEPYDFGEEDDAEFAIEFRGGAEGLVRMVDGKDGEEDFFRNWRNLMPGDTVTGQFRVTDKYNLPVEIFFSTESDADDELISTLTLTITDNDGNVVFNGPMSTVIDNPVSLGKFGLNSEKVYDFTVSVPTWLQNRFSLLETHTKWIFDVYTEDEVNLPATGGKGFSEIAISLGALLIIAALVRVRKGAFGSEA